MRRRADHISETAEISSMRSRASSCMRELLVLRMGKFALNDCAISIEGHAFKWFVLGAPIEGHIGQEWLMVVKTIS